MLILEKNKIYCEILRAMDVYGSACFEPEIPQASLSNHRVEYYGSRPGNGMYYTDSSFNMGTWQTVKGCLIELFVQTELYYCCFFCLYCRSAVHIYTRVMAYASVTFNYLI